MRIRTIVASLAFAGTVVTACGGDGGGPNPVPGLLTVTLATAATPPGAILFTISGGEIQGVTATGYPTYQAALSSTSRKVLLTGSITAGTLVQIQVPDVNQADDYVASVLQVSARGTAAVPYQQLGVPGFSITVGD